jgi:hypothetical protein
MAVGWVMVSERIVGGLIFAAFLVIVVVFTLLFWVPPLDAYSLVALKVVDWVLVVGVSAIAIWLGWVMISTKPIVPEDRPVDQPSTTATQDDSKPT